MRIPEAIGRILFFPVFRDDASLTWGSFLKVHLTLFIAINRSQFGVLQLDVPRFRWFIGHPSG